MKFPVTSTAIHQGKTLIIDPDRETIDVLDASGQLLGDVPWGTVIEQVLDGESESRFAHCRAYPRAPLAVKVQCTAPDGTTFEGLTGGIGGGGFFIESSSPLKSGTELLLEFSLPDRPYERLSAKAKVAWVRSKPERYLLFPGMGVQFVDIDKQTQDLLVNLVEALNRSRTHS
ncbi:MAG TPA: PilZ domain-containing protein [Nitrospira sp.]|nr:PilZ domain-containing protein [Nitrospira sp.]